MGITDIFQLLFSQPITNVLLFFYQNLNSWGVAFALGFSIILLTIFLRILIFPLMSAQIRSSKKMQELAPEMKAIRDKYKKDKKKQQEETMKLYKKYNINPAAGCLPAIVQMPIVFALYHVLLSIVSINTYEKFLSEVTPLLYFDSLKPDRIWATTFLGIELSAKPAELFASNPLIILVPVITGLTQLILSKMMMSKIPAPKSTGPDDFQTSFMKQSLFIFPIMIGFFSFTLPIGLSLYWNTFTIFGILQQYLLVGFGGLIQWLPQLEKYERHSKKN